MRTLQIHFSNRFLARLCTFEWHNRQCQSGVEEKAGEILTTWSFGVTCEKVGSGFQCYHSGARCSAYGFGFVRLSVQSNRRTFVQSRA